MGSDIVEASKDWTVISASIGGYHPDVERVRAETNALAQASAKAFCEQHGLDTVDKMREYAKARASIGHNKPGVGWAHKIMARVKAGEKVPMVAQEKAQLALWLGVEQLEGREPGADDA